MGVYMYLEQHHEAMGVYIYLGVCIYDWGPYVPRCLYLQWESIFTWVSIFKIGAYIYLGQQHAPHASGERGLNLL